MYLPSRLPAGPELHQHLLLTAVAASSTRAQQMVEDVLGEVEGGVLLQQVVLDVIVHDLQREGGGILDKLNLLDDAGDHLEAVGLPEFPEPEGA